MPRRIVAISDTHGLLPTIPACDLLLIAGDLCPIERHDLDSQWRFLDGPFRQWLEAVPASEVVGVAGNHDFLFEHAAERIPRDLRWTYLQDSGCEAAGFRVWGSPWQPPFCDWAFNAQDAERARRWALIPQGTEILVLHGPPRGYGDRVRRDDGRDWENTGCPLLERRIREIAPRLVVFGHIHEGRGVWQQGRTTLANVTLLDASYEPVYEPFVIDLENEPASRPDQQR